MASIVSAFILGGCFCTLFQVIGDFTKAAPPKILLVGVAAGAFLAALGITGALGTFSPAGIGVLVIGFGEVVFSAVQAALAGVWMPSLITLGVVAVFWILGVASGAIRMAITAKDDNE